MREAKNEDDGDPRFAALADMAGKVIQRITVIDVAGDHPKLLIDGPTDIIGIRFEDIDSEFQAFRILKGEVRARSISGLRSESPNLEDERWRDFVSTPKPSSINFRDGVDRAAGGLSDEELAELGRDLRPAEIHARIKYLFHELWTDNANGNPYDKKRWSELWDLLTGIGLSL